MPGNFRNSNVHRQRLASRRLNTPESPSPVPPKPTPWWRVLYVQVLIAVALGILVGVLFPLDKAKPDQWSAAKLEALGKAFIALVKMMIAPIIFCTIVHGIEIGRAHV